MSETRYGFITVGTDGNGLETYNVPKGTTERGAISSREPLTAAVYGRPLNWYRVINGTLYSFHRIRMVNGEVRYVVNYYNGYRGGPQFGCAWSQAHFITVKPA